MTSRRGGKAVPCRRLSRLLPFLGAATLFAVACGSDPTTVVEGPVEVILAGGDSQYGTVGQSLPTPLHVVVRSLTTDLPAEGRTVQWAVTSGDAEFAGKGRSKKAAAIERIGVCDSR